MPPTYTVTSLTVPTPPASPPLPAPKTVSDLIYCRARELPSEPILGYPRTGLEYEEYTFHDLLAFSHEAASIYSHALASRRSSTEAEKVVAILGSSTLDYFVTTLALSRLGFTVLFLSTRISNAAYISLLQSTKSHAIVVDTPFLKTASALKLVIADLQVVELLGFRQYCSPTASPLNLPKFDLEQESNKVCWIIHSSGSTGLPKPIFQTHSAALRNYEHNMNLQGFITLPLFHAHGISSVFRAITSYKKIYMYSATLPLTRQNLLETLRKRRFEIFYGVPYALKLLSETSDGIDALAAMKVVMFGGSACPDALGDVLVSRGVNLISHYGTTETGQLMTSVRPQGDKAWNYVRVHEKLQPYVRWEEQGANLFELVILPGWPSLVASNRPDGAYATKDIFEPHPSIDGAWKYSARLDDTIVLVNGEKAVPTTTEQSVRQLPSVREAVIFGTGKSRLGMLVIPSVSADDAARGVWPSVAEGNKSSPAYAQITEEMISYLPVGTAYPQTDKGTVIRQAFYRTFQKEIEAIYQRLETVNSSGSLLLNQEDLCKFLHQKVSAMLPENDAVELDVDTDLFSLGVDSLQSARLRTTILQNIQLNTHPLPQNVVFENPTISRLAAELIRIRESGDRIAKDVIPEMENLVSKYSTFIKHVPVLDVYEHECILVTGATGSLGAHIVAQLAARDDIQEVYCLVRAQSDTSAHDRVIRSLQERSVYRSLPLAARRKIKCLRSNFADPQLGLSDDEYTNISRKISHLVHCAWSVNFNKSLSSFENDCIAGTCNLIRLCLSAKRPTPASFDFCSSVSTVACTPGDNVEETLPESFACAQDMGYAQSKLVTEHLVTIAAAQTGMKARVLRVGQIVADTKYGIWNNTEAIPLMLQAATTINAIPTLDENPRWLPVDVVATTVLDISLSSDTNTVYNVVNPHTFHWTRDLLPCLHEAGLDFEEVPQREWIRRLRASNPDPVLNPTIKLVEFFAGKYDNDITTRKSLSYTTTRSEALSPALSSTPQLSQDLVTKFVDHFLSTTWSVPSQETASMSAHSPDPAIVAKVS